MHFAGSRNVFYPNDFRSSRNKVPEWELPRKAIPDFRCVCHQISRLSAACFGVVLTSDPRKEGWIFSESSTGEGGEGKRLSLVVFGRTERKKEYMDVTRNIPTREAAVFFNSGSIP